MEIANRYRISNNYEVNRQDVQLFSSNTCPFFGGSSAQCVVHWAIENVFTHVNKLTTSCSMGNGQWRQPPIEWSTPFDGAEPRLT